MYRKQLIETWKQEEKEPFSGWDFSHLNGRMIEELPPWSYEKRAAELMRRSRSLLDMGTGGGEKLFSLQEYWPESVTVTEEYPPNFRLVKERLEPLGVRVMDVPLNETTPLPFADGEFDLVINRHSGINSAEVSRILEPGGVFLTKQVHGRWADDLLAIFEVPLPWENDTPEYYVPLLEAAGMEIRDVQDWKGKFEFTDVGAIVYYLKAIPWMVPGFSVDTHLDYLFKLEEMLQEDGQLLFTARTFLIEAEKK